jgi:putative DNA primase/helicase
MISAIAGAFNHNGVSAHGVLTFQGEQYVGKTKWFKSLVPEHLNLTKDGVILRPDDRDSVKQAVSFWLVELGELDSTFRKSDVAQLKAFITQDKDVLRRAYARKESNYARRTVFFASVNPKQFLHDPTGNRRYWTVEVEAIDHTHGLDMQQIWAQVYEQHYKTGATHFLSNDEYHQLNNQNEDFTVSDPIEETIQRAYDWEQKDTFWRWRTSTEILKECGFDRPTKADTTACGLAVRKLNNNQGKRSTNGRVLLVPELKIDARPPY